MVGRPRNLELLAHNGSNTFDVNFLNVPGGSAIQPSRNGDENDLFDPSNPLQDDPLDFITVTVKIYDEGTDSYIAPPGAYNAPAVKTFHPQGHVIPYYLNGAIRTLTVPVSLHAEVEETIVTNNDFRIPPTNPTRLPNPGTWFYIDVQPERWRFGVWFVREIEVQMFSNPDT